MIVHSGVASKGRHLGKSPVARWQTHPEVDCPDAQIHPKSLTVLVGLGVSQHIFNDMNPYESSKLNLYIIKKTCFLQVASMLWVSNRQKDPAKLLSVKAVLTLNSSASSVNLKVMGSETFLHFESMARTIWMSENPISEFWYVLITYRWVSHELGTNWVRSGNCNLLMIYLH